MPRDFDELVARLSDADLRARLLAVSELRGELDALERSFVADAVRDGWSWTQIGAALGISKQAAHARHRRSPAVEAAQLGAARDATQPAVSADARLAVRLAREEAAALGQTAVGTEHLLLGVLRMEQSAAAAALRALGASLDSARGAVEPTLEVSSPLAATSTPQTAVPPRGRRISPLARQVLERSLREALDRGEGRLGVEQLLAAVLRDPDGGAARTLERLGISAAAVVARLERTSPSDSL